jgi:3-oxoacyl-[acyl-carrier-protein] synthase I
VVVNAQLNDTVLPRTKLLLALPERDPITVNWRLENAFVPALCQRAGIYPIASSRVVLGGRTSVFELLAGACEALDQGECDLCIVGGVDSYLFKHRLDALHLNGLLRSKKNVDGVIPGEAASFIVVEREENALRRGVKPIARVSGIGISSEINSAETGKNSSGVGLTMAIRQAATALTLPAKIVYSDLNGESYPAVEWGLAQVRIAEHLYSPFELRHPAQNYGDTGAATGALLLTLAAYDLKPNEYRKSAKYPALLFATSITGARMAAVLTSME